MLHSFGAHVVVVRATSLVGTMGCAGSSTLARSAPARYPAFLRALQARECKDSGRESCTMALEQESEWQHAAKDASQELLDKVQEKSTVLEDAKLIARVERGR